MATPEKVRAVEEMTEILGKAKSVFVADFQGLNVEQISLLRKKCREDKVQFLVVKNKLARIAAKNAGWDQMEAHFKGPSAIAFTYEDPSAPARVISAFAKDTERPAIKVSLFEGNFYGPEQVKTIASLPSREVLIAQVLGGLNGPIQGLAGALNGLLGKLVRTLDAVRANKS
jgi:large subunit ribosomal protein L10